MGQWKKLKLNDSQEDKDLFVSTQLAIRSSNKCSFNTYMNEILISILEGKKKEGQAFIIKENEFTAIFATKFIECKQEYMIVSTFTNPFTAENAEEMAGLMGDVIEDFIKNRSLDYCLASHQLTLSYEDTQYYAAGYTTIQDLLDLLNEQWKSNDLEIEWSESDNCYIINYTIGESMIDLANIEQEYVRNIQEVII